MKNKNKNKDAADEYGLWKCCDGAWYTAGGRCLKCGRTKQERDEAIGADIPAKLPAAKPESVAVTALDGKPEKQDFVPRNDARFVIILSRGYSRVQLDFDNLVASFKALRDAITENLLKSKSDAEKDGLQWEYRQYKGQGTKIAIYEREKNE